VSPPDIAAEQGDTADPLRGPLNPGVRRCKRPEIVACCWMCPVFDGESGVKPHARSAADFLLFASRTGEMSARTYLVCLQSLEPIRKAIGSKDRALLDALLQAVREDRRSDAEGMIMGPPPAKEPGCWGYLVEPLAQHFGLSPRRLPFDDWKHYYVWGDYRSLADPLLSEQGKKLLEFMDSGRPFVGSSIDHDGSMFAWLTAAEAKSLLDELSAIDAAEFGELDEFHEELVGSLQETVDSDADLFVGAH
jgi:hypothetical protein